MLTQIQLNKIAKRREDGEGLESIIRDMGLNVQATLMELKKHHRPMMDAAKQKQREKQAH
jgi:hypothetical protein